jgi:hypothetical protein
MEWVRHMIQRKRRVAFGMSFVLKVLQGKSSKNVFSLYGFNEDFISRNGLNAQDSLYKSERDLNQWNFQENYNKYDKNSDRMKDISNTISGKKR